MNIPEQITAGDSVSWRDVATRDNLGNPITSADWTLTYWIRLNENNHGVTLTGVVDGAGWLTTITATQSDALTAGHCFWQASATKGSDRVTLGSGRVEILANLAYAGSPTKYDGRSEAEKALDAINAEISARLNGGTAEEYMIGNRRLRKTSMKDLIALQSRYNTIVIHERQAQTIAQGLGNPRALYVRF